MITFDVASKEYRDGTEAVAGLSMKAPEAAITVLIRDAARTDLHDRIGR